MGWYERKMVMMMTRSAEIGFEPAIFDVVKVRRKDALRRDGDVEKDLM